MVLLLPLLSAKKTCSRHFSMCYAWHAPRVTNVCDFLTRRDSLLVNRLYSCSLESRPERVREWVLQFHKEQWFIKQCVLIFFRFPESVYATTITSQRKAGSGTWRQSSRFSIVLGSGPLNANVFHVFKVRSFPHIVNSFSLLLFNSSLQRKLSSTRLSHTQLVSKMEHDSKSNIGLSLQL